MEKEFNEENKKLLFPFKYKNNISEIFLNEKYKHYLKGFFILIMIVIIIIHYDKTAIKFMRTDYPEYMYIKRRYISFLNKLPLYNHTHQTSKTIFWCWFQGLENTPKLYLSCLNSIRKNCKDFNIIIINETNMNNYVEFPDYILEKYKKKYMTPTHLSDLLRLELLIKYGGTWIDASVLISKYEEKFYNNDLFFFQMKDEGCVGSSWFITSEKNSPILRTTRDLMYEYWKRNDSLYNYFLFHIFFKMACEKYEKDFKNIPFVSNSPPHALQSYLTQKYSESKYNELINQVSVHKLTIKIKNIPENSFFYHIIEDYYPN